MKSGGKKCTLSLADKPALALPFIITAMARSPTEQFTFNPCRWCILLRNLNRVACLSLFFPPQQHNHKFSSPFQRDLRCFKVLPEHHYLYIIFSPHLKSNLLLQVTLCKSCSKIWSWNTFFTVCYGGPDSSSMHSNVWKHRQNTRKWRKHLHAENEWLKLTKNISFEKFHFKMTHSLATIWERWHPL